MSFAHEWLVLIRPVTEDLENLVRHVLQSMAAEIESLESDLLVNLEADLQDLSGDPALTPSTTAPNQDLHLVTARLEQQVTTSLRCDIGRELAAYAAGEVVSVGMGRLGVSAGIPGAGTGSSWANLGIGLLVGLVIDEIVSRIWDWWADPVGQLSAAVQDELKAVEARLVEGDADWPGLRKVLMDQTLQEGH